MVKVWFKISKQILAYEHKDFALSASPKKFRLSSVMFTRNMSGTMLNFSKHLFITVRMFLAQSGTLSPLTSSTVCGGGGATLEHENA